MNVSVSLSIENEINIWTRKCLMQKNKPFELCFDKIIEFISILIKESTKEDFDKKSIWHKEKERFIYLFVTNKNGGGFYYCFC